MTQAGVFVRHLSGQLCVVFPVNNVSDGLRQLNQRVDIQRPLRGHRQHGDNAQS